MYRFLLNCFLIIIGVSCYIQHINKANAQVDEYEEVEIVPSDSLWRSLMTQPLDSIGIKQKEAYDSLSNYVFDYFYYQGIKKGKIKFKQFVHYTFWFRCAFSKSGEIQSVEGKYGYGNDPCEDAMIDYLWGIPRYENWETMSSCFTDSVISITFPIVF